MCVCVCVCVCACVRVCVWSLSRRLTWRSATEPVTYYTAQSCLPHAASWYSRMLDSQSEDAPLESNNRTSSTQAPGQAQQQLSLAGQALQNSAQARLLTVSLLLLLALGAKALKGGRQLLQQLLIAVQRCSSLCVHSLHLAARGGCHSLHRALRGIKPGLSTAPAAASSTLRGRGCLGMARCSSSCWSWNKQCADWTSSAQTS